MFFIFATQNSMNMKKTIKLLLILVALALLPACNKGEGKGGTGTIQGYVKLVHHPDDDFELNVDTMAAAKTDVFIVYGDDPFYGDDVETGSDGLYRFEYLLPGNYTVYAYSTLLSGEKVAVSEEVVLSRGAVAQVPTIYIHDGKAYGTSIVKGQVHASYYHNGSYRGEGWACEHRVYIRRVGEELYFDDARVGVDGYFFFQKLQPGEYEVFTVTENYEEVPSLMFKTVTVGEAGQVYELDEPFEVVINV